MIWGLTGASALVTISMQYEAWKTPSRWRPIIAEAKSALERTHEKPNEP